MSDPLAVLLREELGKHRERNGPSGNQEAVCWCGWNGGLITPWTEHVAEVLSHAINATPLTIDDVFDAPEPFYRLRGLEPFTEG